jgi:hypothetical protein
MNTQLDIGARCPCLGTAATFANQKSSLDSGVKVSKDPYFKAFKGFQ